MSLEVTTFKGIVWSLIQKWGQQAISFLSFLLLARLLNPEIFGLVALAGVFLAFMEIFLDQGLTLALVQRRELDPEHLDTAFWTNIVVNLLITTASLGGAEAIARLLNEPEVAPILQWLSLGFIFKSLNAVQEAIFSRKLLFKLLAIRSLISISIGSVVGLGMALSGYGVWSLVAKQLITGLSEVLVLWKVSEWRPKFRISWKHLQELLNFGIHILGNNVLTFLNRYSDNLLIGYFLGTTALGYYTVAYRLLTVMTELLTSATARVALPVFSKLQDEPIRLRNAFYKATKLTGLVAFPCFLGIAVLAPELVPIVFGKQWSSSIPVMQVLSFIGILHSIYYFNSIVIMALGKPAWRLWINLLNTIVNVPAFVIAVQWGIIAVAMSYVIRGYLLSPISLLAMRKLAQISIVQYLQQFITPITGSVLMVSTILGIKYVLKDLSNSYVILIVCITAGAAVYLTAIKIMAPVLFQQLLDLTRLKRSSKSSSN